jgi:hypothetical protein
VEPVYEPIHPTQLDVKPSSTPPLINGSTKLKSKKSKKRKKQQLKEQLQQEQLKIDINLTNDLVNKEEKTGDFILTSFTDHCLGCPS